MKFVIGWLNLRPGKRDEFMALARPFIATTLKGEGVEFFEFHLSSTDPDTVIVVERYRTPEAQDLHQQTAHFAEMWGHVQKLCIEARFENIFADRVDPDFARFAEPGLGPISN
jgi:quinol monooxygenase YgiN